MNKFNTPDWEKNKIGDKASEEFIKVSKVKLSKRPTMKGKKASTSKSPEKNISTKSKNIKKKIVSPIKVKTHAKQVLSPKKDKLLKNVKASPAKQPTNGIGSPAKISPKRQTQSSLNATPKKLKTNANKLAPNEVKNTPSKRKSLAVISPTPTKKAKLGSISNGISSPKSLKKNKSDVSKSPVTKGKKKNLNMAVAASKKGPSPKVTAKKVKSTPNINGTPKSKVLKSQATINASNSPSLYVSLRRLSINEMEKIADSLSPKKKLTAPLSPKQKPGGSATPKKKVSVKQKKILPGPVSPKKKLVAALSPKKKLQATTKEEKPKRATAKPNSKLKIKIAGLFHNPKKIANTITLGKAKGGKQSPKGLVSTPASPVKVKSPKGKLQTPKSATKSISPNKPANTQQSKKVKSKNLKTAEVSSSPTKSGNKKLTKREQLKNRSKLSKTLTPSMPKKTETLHKKMTEKLKAARFRYINEQLYTTNSSEASQIFQEDPDSFHAYHAGYRQQVGKWPMNPLKKIINSIQKLPENLIIVDFGCGDAELAKSVKQKVHSFDLVAKNEDVIACDMAHVPLDNNSADVAVFCLSLMGTNLHDYLLEANRVLKVGGILKIAEVESRFDKIENFIDGVERFGFSNTHKDLNYNLFYFMDFQKSRDLKNKKNLPTMSLHPCMYKKR